MARQGLPKSYIKKWGISKRAWKEYHKVHPKKGAKKKTTGKSPKKTSRSRRSSTRRSNPSGGARVSYTEKWGTLWRKVRTILNMTAPALREWSPAGPVGPIDYKLQNVLRNYTGFDARQGNWVYERAAPAWASFVVTGANDWWDRKTRKSAKVSKGKLVHVLSEAVPALQAHIAASGHDDYLWRFADVYNKRTCGYSLSSHTFDLSRVNMYAGAKAGAWIYDKVIPSGVKRTLNNAFPKGVNPF